MLGLQRAYTWACIQPMKGLLWISCDYSNALFLRYLSFSTKFSSISYPFSALAALPSNAKQHLGGEEQYHCLPSPYWHHLKADGRALRLCSRGAGATAAAANAGQQARHARIMCSLTLCSCATCKLSTIFLRRRIAPSSSPSLSISYRNWWTVEVNRLTAATATLTLVAAAAEVSRRSSSRWRWCMPTFFLPFYSTPISSEKIYIK